MQYLKFVSWLWHRLETWKRVYLTSAFVFVLALSLPDPWRFWILTALLSLGALWVLKWAVLDPLRDSWQQYQRERLELFDRIRRSDQSH